MNNVWHSRVIELIEKSFRRMKHEKSIAVCAVPYPAVRLRRRRKVAVLEFVNVVSSAENISFSAKVSAQYSDKTAQFTLGYEQTADGASVSVIEPGDAARHKGKRHEEKKPQPRV